MILAILMVLGAGIFRLAAHGFHWWNIAPVAAMALLGGMYLGRRYALWVPLAVLLATDVVLNVWMGYPIIYWPRAFDYAAFLLVGFLTGIYALWLYATLRPRLGPGPKTAAITGIAVWILGSLFAIVAPVAMHLFPYHLNGNRTRAGAG